MAIAKISKFDLIYLRKDRPALIRALQKFADVHFNDLKMDENFSELALDFASEGRTLSEARESLSRIRASLKILAPYQLAPKSFVEKFSTALPEISFDEMQGASTTYPLEEILAELNALYESREKLKQSIAQLEERKNQLEPWRGLDIAPDSFRRLKQANALTGYLPRRWREDLVDEVAKFEKSYIEIISEDGRNLFVFVMAHIDESTKLLEALRQFAFVELNLGGRERPLDQIEELRRRQTELRAKLALVEEDMRIFSREHAAGLRLQAEFAAQSLVEAEEEQKIALTSYAAFMQGYVPTEREAEFKALVSELTGDRSSLQIAAAELDDPKVPIILQNNRWVQPFEAIVSTFSLPMYNELDPTPVMMPWYSLFFGLMVGDFGYGLLQLIATTAALKFFKFKEGTRSFLRFFQILSIPTIFAGLFFGGFFGGLIPMPAVIDPSKDYMELIIASLVIGLLNVVYGLGVKAYVCIRDGRPLDAVWDVLVWYMVLGGAIAMLLTPILSLAPLVSTIGKVVMILGFIGVVLFSARDNEGFGRYGWGLYNAYGVTSYVGDLVSYTRIAALALSGGFIGYAVNLIAKMLLGSGIIGIISGVLVIAIFHLFNMFLSCLSGYVHAMRLIYVEFFGKFFGGGGIPFKRFRAQSEFYDVK